jgi:hypothetical protein
MSVLTFFPLIVINGLPVIMEVWVWIEVGNISCSYGMIARVKEDTSQEQILVSNYRSHPTDLSQRL